MSKHRNPQATLPNATPHDNHRSKLPAPVPAVAPGPAPTPDLEGRFCVLQDGIGFVDALLCAAEQHLQSSGECVYCAANDEEADDEEADDEEADDEEADDEEADDGEADDDADATSRERLNHLAHLLSAAREASGRNVAKAESFATTLIQQEMRRGAQ